MQMTLLLKVEEEVLIFIGEQDVTLTAKQGCLLATDKCFYMHSGAVLWTFQNKIEYVYLRNGKPKFNGWAKLYSSGG